MNQTRLFPACDLPTATRWEATASHSPATYTGIVGLRHRPAVLKAVSRALLDAAVRDAAPTGVYSIRLWCGDRWRCDCPRIRVLPPTRAQPWRAWAVGLGVIRLGE